MLHGLLLYVVLGLLIGPESVASLPVLEHWLVVVGCAPVLITVCTASFRMIEAPAMTYVPKLTLRLEGLLAKKAVLPGKLAKHVEQPRIRN